MPLQDVNFRFFALLLLLPAAAVQSAESSTEEEELTKAYGDTPMVSIATGRQQAVDRAPSVATVITANDIRAMGATSLEQALESVPGMHVSVSSYAYTPILSIRGIDTTYNPHVLLLINGVPMNTAFLGNRGPGWGGLPVENVERIEVIRGPGSALYGADAFSGVINVITKGADEVHGTEVGARAGSFQSHDAWVQHGSRHGELETSFYLRDGHTDGERRTIDRDFQSLINPAISLAPGPVNLEEDARDARVDLGWQQWHLRGAWQERELASGAGLAESLDPYSRFPTTRLYLDLSREHAAVANDWELSFMGGYSDVKEMPGRPAYMLFPPGANFGGGAFPDGVIGNPGRAERHAYSELSAFYSGFAQHHVRLGSGYRLEDLYETSEVKNFRLAPYPVPLGGMVDVTGTPDIYLTPHRREVRYVFAQDEWNLAQDWALTTGVRYDHYSDFGDTTNPRIALVWNASYNLVAKMLYGRAFRAPSFSEQYQMNNPVTIGNPALQPETINTRELALAWQAASNVQTNLSLFQYDMHDIIRYVANADPTTGFTAQNAGDQTGRGMELESTWDPVRTLRLTGNVSLQRSIDETTGKDAGLAPHQHLFARADWRFAPAWQFGSTVNRVADRRRQPGDTRPDIPDYTTLDLSLRREKLLGNGELRASVLNVFNADAREPSVAPGNIPDDLPLAGRSFVVQFQYHMM